MCLKEILNSLMVRYKIHKYPTRQNHLIELLLVKLEKCNSSHIIKKIKLFNKLPKGPWAVALHKCKIITEK